jgi:thioredoxin reductase (NADPH)
MYDVIIIGSGPAGYSAAIYTSRAQLKTLLLAGQQPGGQLTTTTEIENFPGFPKGIYGTQLMTDIKAQAERFGTEIQASMCQCVKVSKNTTFIVMANGKKYEGRSVIIATGASAQHLGLSSEKTFAGKGVSACATCDGFFFRGKEVVVVGGGDTAMEEATFLAKFASKVTIIHRRDEFRASAIMLDRAKKDAKISFLTNNVIEEILGDKVVTGVRLKDVKTGRQEEIETQGVFLAIGHKPNTEFLREFIKLDTKGYVVLKQPISALEPETETSVLGVFAAGDCVDPRYRQAIVAAGMGAMAAIDAQKYLEEHA